MAPARARRSVCPVPVRGSDAGTRNLSRGYFLDPIQQRRFVSFPLFALRPPPRSEAKPVFIPIQSLLIFPHECQESSFLRPHIVNSGSDVRPLQERGKEAASHLACLIIRGTNADRACERASERERWSRLQISIGDSVFRPEIPAAFLPRRVRVLRLSLSLSLSSRRSTERLLLPADTIYRLRGHPVTSAACLRPLPLSSVQTPKQGTRRDGVRNTGRQNGQPQIFNANSIEEISEFEG